MKTEMKTEMKWDEMLALTFLTQVEIERNSILNYTPDVKEFVNHSVELDDINVILIYGVTNSKCFNHICRMAIYPKTSTQSVYRNGSAIDNQGYTVQDVKDMAKKYLSYFCNII